MGGAMGKRRSPTAVLMEHLGQNGFLCQVVEKWIPGANVRKDLFGFIDVVAISQNCATWGIQVTDEHNVNARLAKIRTECLDATIWLMGAGWHLFVYGLRPDGTWRIVEITLEELFDD